MAYKKNIVVISVPIDIDSNRMLREIALFNREKSKTQTASRILTKAIRLEYSRTRKEQQWDRNTNT